MIQYVLNAQECAAISKKKSQKRTNKYTALDARRKRGKPLFPCKRSLCRGNAVTPFRAHVRRISIILHRNQNYALRQIDCSHGVEVHRNFTMTVIVDSENNLIG